MSFIENDQCDIKAQRVLKEFHIVLGKYFQWKIITL